MMTVRRPLRNRMSLESAELNHGAAPAAAAANRWLSFSRVLHLQHSAVCQLIRSSSWFAVDWV